ncbi:hypothetical protein C8R45DRAFT_933143 [Mycena sanguinolenta]|nr:hypothetical protein C8R45DRAFT_933143 [Mycena sanguinolenta]
MDNLIGKCPNSQPAAIGSSNSDEFLIVDTNASIANSSDTPPIDVDDDDNTVDPIEAEGDAGNSDVDNSTEVTAPGSKRKKTAAQRFLYTHTESTTAPVPAYKKSKMDLYSVSSSVQRPTASIPRRLLPAVLKQKHKSDDAVFQRKMQIVKLIINVLCLRKAPSSEPFSSLLPPSAAGVGGVDAVRAMFLEEFGVISSVRSNTHTLPGPSQHSSPSPSHLSLPSDGLIFSTGSGYNGVPFYSSPQW